MIQKIINDIFQFCESKKFEHKEAEGLLSSRFGYAFNPSAGHDIVDKVMEVKSPVETTKFYRLERCLRETDSSRIGISNRHLNFFEMFEFSYAGDSEKIEREEATTNFFKLLTQKLKLDSKKLFVTTFGGAKIEQLDLTGQEPEIQLLHELWARLLSEKQVVKVQGRRNFFYSRKIGHPGGTGFEIYFQLNDKNYIEIASQVYYEYIFRGPNSLHKTRNIALGHGIGIERLLMAIEGKQTIYDVSLFQPIKNVIKEFMKDSAIFLYEENINILADHFRTVAFIIMDGQLVDSSGRGKSLRKLIKEIFSQIKYLGISEQDKFISICLDKTISIFQDRFPQLTEKRQFINDEINKVFSSLT